MLVINTKTNKFVIKNFNLKIEPNKTYAFIGPSGSGKSTGGLNDWFIKT